MDSCRGKTRDSRYSPHALVRSFGGLGGLGVFGIFMTVAGCYDGLSASAMAGDDSQGAAGAEGGSEGGPGSDRDPLNGALPDVGSPLRRLTHREYANSVRDLLGIELAIDLGVESELEGLVDDASQQAVPIALAEGYLAASQAVSAEAVSDVPGLTGCPQPDPSCMDAFVRSFGRRALRRPLTDAEVEHYVGLHDDVRAKLDETAGVQAVVQALLMSPGFMYLVEGHSGEPGNEALTDYEIASRMSYLVWDTMPDEPLLAAAEQGQLSSAQGRLEQLDRMLADDKATETVTHLHQQWLGLRPAADLAEHMQTGEAKAAEALDEVLGFMQAWFFDDAEFDELYSAPTNIVPQPGVDADEPVAAGILASRALLTSHAEAGSPAPILRGVFVLERLLCTKIPAAPPDAPEPPDPDPNASTRDWLEEHRENPTCAACHDLIDPYGLVFEHFDDQGQFRLEDGGKPVDASAELGPVGDISGPVKDLPEFAARMAASDQARGCAMQLWYRSALGRITGEEDAELLAEFTEQWASEGGSAMSALRSLVASDLFVTRIVR